MKIGPSRIFFSAALLATLAATGFFIFGHDRDLFDPQVSSGDVLASGPAAVAGEGSNAPARGTESSPRTLAVSTNDHGQTFYERLEDLLERAKLGDSSALAFADRITGLCAGFITFPDEHDTPLVNSPEQRAARRRVEPFCESITRADVKQLPPIERELLLQRNPWAMARHFRTPASVSEDFGVNAGEIAEWAWQESLNSNDPETTRALLDTLFNRWDTPAARLPETRTILEEFNAHPAFANSGGLRRQEVRAFALDVLACRQGANCRAYGNMQESYCIYRGLCASHLTADQFILEHLVTRHERQAVEQFIASLRSTRDSGRLP